MDNGTIWEVILIVFLVAGHIFVTYVVYKKKGGMMAGIYFFMAPVAIFLLLLLIDSKYNSKNHRR